MRRLPLPPIAAADVYTSAISIFASKDVGARLSAAQGIITQEEASYISNGRSLRLDLVATAKSVNGNLTIDEMKAVYKEGMSKSGSPGRIYYDTLMSSVPHSTCPLCGQGKVRNLDHHLPQSKYPALVVTPSNLVPACRDCNMTKVVIAPKSEGEQTIHPYFDDFSAERWLYASVEEVDPPVLKYEVRLPPGWAPIVENRLQQHMKVFKLKQMFTLYAGEEMSQISNELLDLKTKGGIDAVKLELRDRAERRERVHRNSWQTAMFYGLSASDWFCDTGLPLLRPVCNRSA